jgi:hypothetical protein
MRKITVELAFVSLRKNESPSISVRVEDAKSLLAAVHFFGYEASMKSFSVSPTGNMDPSMVIVDRKAERYVCEVDEPENRATLLVLWPAIQRHGRLSENLQDSLRLKIKDEESRRTSEIIKFSMHVYPYMVVPLVVTG